MLRRRSRFSLILMAGAVGALAFAMSANSAVATPAADVIVPVELATSNAALVHSLNDEDSCLWRHEVFPDGGVGAQIASLPYSQLSPDDRDLNTFRAEVLRNNTSEVLDVYPEVDESGQARISILTTSKSTLATSDVSSLVSTSSPGRQALLSLHSKGLVTETIQEANGGLAAICEVENYLLETDAVPAFYFDIDLESGTLGLHVTKQNEAAAQRVSGLFPGLVAVHLLENDFSSSSRGTALPAQAGAYIRTSINSTYCSTAFRIAGSALITANHCDWAGGQSWMGRAGSTVIGKTGSGVYQPTLVDAQLISGLPSPIGFYQRDMYTGLGQGYGDSSASIPAYGIFPTYTLTPGGSLIASGGRTGQNNVTFSNTQPTNGCARLASGDEACQLHRFNAAAGYVADGDSGGPVAAYDPANGRVIPAAIITASNGFEGPHEFLATSVLAISYLYGNATIG
ncbi:MAG: hypothetical protein ACTH31_00735 [Pseudoclavibacter sp.]